ncbi:hypothetical protein HYPSUDRAFT_40701 [Hypholoma sublateritium FD-334 SS-4]|uniref:Uncharacterized protein n=1 Tax=Hypholoma sublateritium (strain FD-334 SS-4) TaxID=945553 RepID=A0A0D2NJR8_HYPSF|nr:hypothetical protein HYPSUDRAFT_44597 [Hypholoma sublateritium FD-334 SS-4]KJA22637.1 hypothetical protein HYPSUDRAFT_40701 [Hypholoma sublateritium FD-334 SS-4]
MLIHLSLSIEGADTSYSNILTPTSLEDDSGECERPNSHLCSRVGLVVRYSMLGQVGDG